MKVRDILSGLVGRGFHIGKTIGTAFQNGQLHDDDDYAEHTGCGHPCYRRRGQDGRGQYIYIGVATQVGSEVISFGPKGCGML